MTGKKVWKIVGEGLDSPFQKTIPISSISEREVVAMLQRLTSKYLDEDEICSASIKQTAPGYSVLLEPQYDRGGKRRTITVGHSPFFVAYIWDSSEG
ncbi:MAG: hypothetical protein FJX42_06500 [Alphaproteobacteria bacterium]|nr:hypothetical protein [Alphaproteobacteria bacterium]